tara:strand:- start:293 stop:592 length:300 start_codon:yes stop_codon:yes gene_type:complete
MHSLSLGTWFIHIATLFEWSIAIIVISLVSNKQKNSSLNWLAIAMIPNLVSAMAAITWHIYDNSIELKGLVVLQAGLTVIGNTTMAIAAFNIFRVSKEA